MGTGGTSLLFSTGYDSFFGNPAGFAGPGSLTLGDASLWGYLPTTPEGFNNLKTILSDVQPPQPETETAFNVLLSKNIGQVGFGGSIGLGWAGKGFGLGANIVSDAKLMGTSFSGSSIVVQNQVNAILGFGLPISLGFIKIDLGVDARAFYRLDSVAGNWTDAHDLVLGALGYPYDFGALLDSKYMSGGLGYALDAGATLKFGPLMVGFMARDLLGKLQTGDVNVYDLVQNSNLPMDGNHLVVIEPTYTAGIGLKFNENGLIAPSIYAETDDIPGLVSALSSGLVDTETVLASIKVGGELRLLKIFLLRGGLNDNCLSIGAGIDLLLIRADIAMYSEDIGALDPRSGFSVRAAIKL